MKRILCLFLIFIITVSLISGCNSGTEKLSARADTKLNLGELVSEEKGSTADKELKFADENEMLSSMKLALKNSKFELYYCPENMAVAVKEKATGKVTLSNPYNAANDKNYSGVIGEKLASQVVVSYLENEAKVIEMHSYTECAQKGQYTIKTYKNGLSFDLVFGTDTSSGSAFLKVLSKEAYEDICNKVSEDLKDLMDTYYTFFAKSELADSDIFEVYPDVNKQDLYYCNLELSERDIKKLSAVFTEANYTAKMCEKEAQKLNIGNSTESNPYFKMTLSYALTDTGVTVSIPNKTIEYNPEFPLLRIGVLPYFGADVPGKRATGSLFIPDGCGTVINMNKGEPNRRIVITGKVYGDNASALPKKTAQEKVEQYYLPVFGTVRNNKTAVFGNIVSGDGNCEITAHLGRPNGNYYAVNPEFIIRDYEQYTRVSVVENPWSNKVLYLYDKNAVKDDLTVEYTLLSGKEANYSAMANVYRQYLFGDKNNDTKQSTLNIQTVGSAVVEDNFLGFSYDNEAVFTSYKDNINIIEYLKKNGADNVSLLLKGWQKDGLDAEVSNKIRLSSDSGGKSGLKKLTEYCKDNGIILSLYNNISFVGIDKHFDGFKPKTDAARTLELKYAKKSELSPDTMLYDDGKYVVKASSYGKYLSELTSKAYKYAVSSLNMGELGTSLNADYSRNASINRNDALRYIKAALENNKETDLSFDKGNAYILNFAKEISDISIDNSGFPGETAAIPFLQMVIGGNISYSSEPINLKADKRLEILKCIESGTVPTYLLSYGNTSMFKNTGYTAYYSIDFDILKQSIIENYEYIDKVLKKTEGGRVVNHKILTDGVSVSTYENGTKVYVNKTDKDYKNGGITVKANDYKVKG